MVVYGGIRFVYGGLRLFIVVYGWLWFMVVYGGLRCLWWFTVVYEGFWLFTLV